MTKPVPKAPQDKPGLKIVGDAKPADINPFNLEELVVQPAYKIGSSMQTSAATIPVQDKAGPQTFFMTHPDPQYAQVFWGVKWHESANSSRGEYYDHPPVRGGGDAGREDLPAS